NPPPPQRHAIGYAASAVIWRELGDFLGAGLRGPRSAGILSGCPSSRTFRETAGTFSKPRRGGCPHPPGWGLFPSHVGAGALTRPGGDFFRAAEQNLPSHTCHSEERRDESLLSNTCHSESASAVRNLLFAGVPLDKSEGVVKTEISWAVREHRLLCQRRLRTKTLEISPESLCGGIVPPTI